MKKRLAFILAVAMMLTLTGYTAREWTSRQTTAHQIAELARGMGLPEDDPIIIRASEIWWEEEATIGTASDDSLRTMDGPNEPENAESEAVRPTDGSNAEPTRSNTSNALDLYGGVLDYAITYDPETEWLAVALAQTVYGEFRGGWSQTEQACIIWTVLNRVDAGMYSDVYSALTAPWQFAYSPYAPTYDDYGRDLTALARDVLFRWRLEHEGQTDVGRVLPSGYCWYSGDGRHNYFRASYNGSGAIWFGLASPYES